MSSGTVFAQPPPLSAGNWHLIVALLLLFLLRSSGGLGDPGSLPRLPLALWEPAAASHPSAGVQPASQPDAFAGCPACLATGGWRCGGLRAAARSPNFSAGFQWSSCRRLPHRRRFAFWPESRTMDERFNKWLLTPVLTLLFLIIMYQYVSPTCTSSCTNFGDKFRAGESGQVAAAPAGPREDQQQPPPRDQEAEIPGSPAAQLAGPVQEAEEEFEELEEEEEEQDRESQDNGSLPRFVPRFNFSAKDLTRFVDFNIKGRHVIVFLPIQKTGGTTFGRHLVKNIRLEQPCSCKPGQKKCTCHRPGRKETWLFSRFSTGWSCGLHPDWTELTNCVPAIMEKECPRNHSRIRYGHSLLDTFFLPHTTIFPSPASDFSDTGQFLSSACVGTKYFLTLGVGIVEGD